MTPDDIEAVRRCLKWLVPVSGEAGQLFYEQLEQLNAELRTRLPPGDLEHGEALVALLGEIASHLDRRERLLPVLARCRRDDVHRGLRPGDYDTLGRALIWMLRVSLGARFTEATRNSCETVYAQIVVDMLAAPR